MEYYLLKTDDITLAHVVVFEEGNVMAYWIADKVRVDYANLQAFKTVALNIERTLIIQTGKDTEMFLQGMDLQNKVHRFFND